MSEILHKFRSEVFKHAAIVTVMALAAFWLASCSPFPGEKPSVGDGGGTPTLPLPNTETPTATATSTETPTATITPTPTEIPFSPETWAGTDQVRLDFLQNLKDWGVTDFTCGDDGICRDAERKILFDNGRYDIFNVLSIFEKSTILKSANLKPKTGNVPINSLYASNEVLQHYLPIFALTRDEYTKKNDGVDVFTDPGLGFFLINFDTLSWVIVAGEEMENPKSQKYLVGETVDKPFILPLMPVEFTDLEYLRYLK
jgi:hypothetical protein